jgi:hypothetical protein
MDFSEGEGADKRDKRGAPSDSTGVINQREKKKNAATSDGAGVSPDSGEFRYSRG